VYWKAPREVSAAIHENHHLTVREVSEEVGMSENSCHTILTEKLEMHRVAAKFVPCLLTDEQKVDRITVSQELFDCSNADENFLKNVITGDETWVYGNNIEIKVQSLQQRGKSLLRPKKACQSRSNVKVVLIFFLWEGHRSSCVCSMCSDSQWTVLLGGHEAVEGG
jgi:hypothetical protein